MAATGIAVVQTLQKEDYAWFTLYSSLSAMMALVADSGLAAGLNSLGGRVLPDINGLLRVFAAAKAFRMRLSLVASIFVGAIGTYLLIINNCPVPLTILILALTTAGMFLTTTYQMNIVVHNLLGHRRMVQASSILSHTFRLALICVCYYSSTLNAISACVTAFLSQWFGTRLTSRQIPNVVNPSPPDESDLRALAQYVRVTMPSAFFACFQSQIGALLLSAFGHTSEVADYGALSRIAVLFSVFGAPLFFIASPAFAKAPTRSHLVRIASLVFIGYLAFCGIALSIVHWFPEPFFWLLGNKYTGLEKELFWVVVGQSAASVDSIFWTLALARGWIRHGWITIPLTLIFQAAALSFIDPRTIVGVVNLSLSQTVARLPVVITLIVVGLRSWHSKK